MIRRYRPRHAAPPRRYRPRHALPPRRYRPRHAAAPPPSRPAAWRAAAAAAAAGALVLSLPQPPPADPVPAVAPSPAVAAPDEPRAAAALPGPALRPVGPPAPPAPATPERVQAPAVGLDAPVAPVGLAGDGTLTVPGDPLVSGWWSGGVKPGQPGPAVLVGHVATTAGPAVFARVHDLRPGDRVAVTVADGSVVTFTVDRVERHHKDTFPTAEVYGPTHGAELRLVTCGGPFDPASRSYRDNVVVFASGPAGDRA